MWKRLCSNPRCVFVCNNMSTHTCMYICASACTLCFQKPTYHAQFCVRESADVIVLMMMVFIYLQDVEKARWGLNRCSVKGEAVHRVKCEPARASWEEGWILLYVGNERKERLSCGMLTSQGSSSPDWSYLCVCVSGLTCQVGFLNWNASLPHALI